MEISVLDGSNYFKGLLLLIRKDRKIADTEIQLLKRIGKVLGFEREFCDNAIQDVLDNEYIVDELPKFSTKALAMKFLKDGLTIAFSDNDFHLTEHEWLLSVAQINEVDLTWFQKESIESFSRASNPSPLEVDDITVMYS